jgi:hypothetical protein
MDNFQLYTPTELILEPGAENRIGSMRGATGRARCSYITAFRF